MDKSPEKTLPVPYEDGDHCVFFAVQEASMFFNQKPLEKTDLSEYRKSIERLEHFGNLIIGDKASIQWLTASLRFISSKLNSIGIKLSEIKCTERTKTELVKDNFIKRSAISIGTVNEDEEYELDWPSLLIIQSKNGNSHVWCCTSEEKFNLEYGKHIDTNDEITMSCKLERLVNN